MLSSHVDDFVDKSTDITLDNRASKDKQRYVGVVLGDGTNDVRPLSLPGQFNSSTYTYSALVAPVDTCTSVYNILQSDIEAHFRGQDT